MKPGGTPKTLARLPPMEGKIGLKYRMKSNQRFCPREQGFVGSQVVLHLPAGLNMDIDRYTGGEEALPPNRDRSSETGKY